MGDDDRPSDAEQRRPADPLVVEDAADPIDAGAHQQRGEATADRGSELVPPEVGDERRQALEELDDDVAEHGVAHDDVSQVPGQVLPLDVALEPQVRRVEQLGGALDAGVALALLLADRQEGDTWPRDTLDAFREDRPHPGVLDEVLRRGVRVGADVQQDHRSGIGDHLDRQRRAVHAGQAAETKHRGGHPGTGVTGRDDGVGATVADEVDRHEDRGVLLLAQGQRRMLVHAHDLAGGDDRHVRRQLARDGPDDRLVADQDDLVSRVRPGVVDGARDHLCCPEVAAHGIDRDADAGTAGDGHGRRTAAHRVSARRRRWTWRSRPA